MASEFEQFTRAVQQQGAASLNQSDPPAIRNVAVLGGGVEGRLLAALSMAQQFSVTLFTAYGEEMNLLRSAGGITLRGEGPVGTYQIDQSGAPSIRTTAELDSAVATADLIFLTGPVHKQRTYAMVLADHLKNGQILVLQPARSFAALETRWLLHVGGCQADIVIVEVQNMPFWVKASDGPLVLNACNSAIASTLPGGLESVVSQLKGVIPAIESAPSALHSAFADASGAVECTALMLGGAPVFQVPNSLPEGAVVLEDHQTIFSLIDNVRCRSALADLLQERRDVARCFGVRNLPADEEWIQMSAGAPSGNSGRSIPSLDIAADIVRCAVIGSLVPLQSAGQIAGVATPVTDAMISLGSSVLGSDLTTAGRRLESMGIPARSVDDARRRMELLVRGER